MEIDFELNRVVEEIKENNAKKVLLQLPDGLKPKAMQIQEAINSMVDCEVFMYLGSCFGACDIPTEAEKLGVDLIVQFGHSEFIR